MKILKYILFTILGIIVLALIVAAFLPKSFHVEATQVINRPVQDVYDYVRYIKNQENYTIWFKMDPAMEKIYSGTDGAVGGSLTWKSKEVGDGKQVITALRENERVDIDLYLMSETDAGKHYFLTEPLNDNSTKVTIALDGHVPYPFNLSMLFYDMNKDFQQNADNLKNLLEK